MIEVPLVTNNDMIFNIEITNDFNHREYIEKHLPSINNLIRLAINNTTHEILLL